MSPRRGLACPFDRCCPTAKRTPSLLSWLASPIRCTLAAAMRRPEHDGQTVLAPQPNATKNSCRQRGHWTRVNPCHGSPQRSSPPKLALDVPRKRLAVEHARVLQERLQMLAHQPVQHLLLRLAPLVLEALLLGPRGCSGGHNRLRKPSACQQRPAGICRKCATRGWRPPLSTGGPPPVPSPLCSSSSLNAASSCTRSRFGTTHCLSRAGNRPRSTARRRASRCSPPSRSDDRADELERQRAEWNGGGAGTSSSRRECSCSRFLPRAHSSGFGFSAADVTRRGFVDHIELYRQL